MDGGEPQEDEILEVPDDEEAGEAAGSAPVGKGSGGGRWWAKKLEVLEPPSDDDADAAAAAPQSFPEQEGPPDLLCQLLPFQKESLYWMARQERSGFRGGILADEMGLGKTIQSIALILTNRDDEITDSGSECDHAPPKYVSEGEKRVEKEAGAAAAKAAKAAARVQAAEAKKAAKEAQRVAAVALKQAQKEAAKAEKEAEKLAAAALKKGQKPVATAPAAAAAEDATSLDVAAIASPQAAAAAASRSAPAGSGGGDDGQGFDAFFSAAAEQPASSADANSSAAAPAAATAAPSAASAAAQASWTSLKAGHPPSPLEQVALDAIPCNATLVVCPVVAMTQWRAEIQKHTRPGCLSVALYHGADRTKDIDVLMGADVVLTSYSILEADFRKMTEPLKVVCKWCKKRFLPQKMRFHLKYFCGPDAVKTAGQARQERTRDGAEAEDRPRSRGRGGKGAAGSESEGEGSGDGASGDDDEGGGSSGASSDEVVPAARIRSGSPAAKPAPSASSSSAAAASSSSSSSAAKGKGKRGSSAPAQPRSKKAAAPAASEDKDDDEEEVVEVLDDEEEEGATWTGLRGSSSAAAAAPGGSLLFSSGTGSFKKKPAPASSSKKSSAPTPPVSASLSKAKPGAASSAKKKRASSASPAPSRQLLSASAGRSLLPSSSGASPRPSPSVSFAAGAGASKGAAAASRGRGGSKLSPASGSKRSAAASGKASSSSSSKKRAKRGGEEEDDSDDSSDSDFAAEEEREDASSSGGDDGAASEEDDGGEGGGKAGSPAARRARGTAAASSSSASSSSKPSSSSSKNGLGPISILHRIRWRRVILDEAHCIKNKLAATSRSAFALSAERRWCLSGTPIQNRVGELQSLVRFLGLKPWGYYFCKNCPCNSQEYVVEPGGRFCDLCGHSPLRHYNFLARYVLNPIKQWGYAGPGKDAMRLLREEVLPSILLRRTKVGRASDLALPSRHITLRDDLVLDAFEADFYNALYTQSKARFDAYVTSGRVLNNYAHIFSLLTLLRQAVDHPYLILYGNQTSQASLESRAAAASSAQEVLDLEGENPELLAAAAVSSSIAAVASAGVCGICREPLDDPVWTGCRHSFCRSCISEYVAALGASSARGALLRDLTNDADAFVEVKVAHESDEDEAAGGKPASKRRRKSAGAASSSSLRRAGAGVAGEEGGEGDDGGVGDGLESGEDGPSPTCPMCLAPLSVSLAPTTAAAATAASSSSSSKPAAAASTSASPLALAAAAAAARKSILARIPSDRVGTNFRSSTKIEALLEELWRSQEEEPGMKAIVFSQFVSMLDLVLHRLTRAGVRCVRLDGGMSVAARDRVILAFKDDPHLTVFLISLKAGGVALNLTAASRVFILDPWWNAAAESQAMDRTHRLGQHRAIRVTRFIVKNTIEERIIALQNKKKLVFEGTVGQDSAALSKLTEEDMRFLFSG